MRPIKLTMTAFESYLETTVINFEDLGTNGLYLIAGDTGAGKTSVFDAIIFALYGKASGDNRDVSMLRSKFATDGITPSVELIFEYQGTVYEIQRRLKESGSSAKLKNITRGDTSFKVISNNFICNLIGLDAQQFKQTVMLAQGDFYKLLFSDSKSKKEIFRNIFRTNLYMSLCNTINADFSTKKDLFKRQCFDLYELTSQFKLISDCECDIPERAKTGPITDADLDFYTDMFKQEEALSVQLANEVGRYHSEIVKQTAFLEKAKSYRLKQEHLNANLQAMEKLEKDIVLANESLKATEPLNDEIKKHNEEISQLRFILPNYEKLSRLKGEKAELEKNCKAIDDKLKNAKARQSKANELLVSSNSEKTSLTNSPVELAQATGELEKASVQIKALNSLSTNVKELAGLKVAHEKAATAFVEASDHLTKCNSRYDALYKQYLNNQAGRLAQKLVENQPCPVCGSTVHPNPAHQAEVVTDTELEGAKKAADKASKDCSEKSRLSGESEATYNAGAAKVLENAATLLDTPNISLDNINTELVKALTELTAKEGELKVRVSKLTTDCNKLERLNKAIPELEKELNSATEQINELNISLTQNSGHLANVNKDVEDLVNTLDYDSLDAAQAQINKLTSLVKAKTDTIEQANNKINKLNIDKSSLSGTIKSQQDDLKDVPQTDISAENEKLNKLNLQYKEVNAKKDSINSMLSFNKLTLEKLQEKNKALLVTQADIQMLAPLEQIASGKDNTDGKIDLETYVQLAYFDKVITKANLRFQELSDGHYYLRRSNELSKKSQGGLDLDIMDRYTDSVRAVKTLSGGESFMASLSLALGLSDVIQESAGGVHLDTLFIDEGFGTLSDNSLNQAMNVLNTLGNSNKLVGIISHIDTLKKRIGKQIVVTKDSKGRSHAKIVCDE